MTTDPVGPGILKFVFIDVKILILLSDRVLYFVVLSVVTDILEESAASSSRLKTYSGKITIHAVYASVSQPLGCGPVPGPGINYTGPREVLPEFVILVF
jgi:hypothetical protein